MGDSSRMELCVRVSVGFTVLEWGPVAAFCKARNPPGNCSSAISGIKFVAIDERNV
jgi:hypothetical protein